MGAWFVVEPDQSGITLQCGFEDSSTLGTYDGQVAIIRPF
jgi:hypothetical protein